MKVTTSHNLYVETLEWPIVEVIIAVLVFSVLVDPELLLLVIIQQEVYHNVHNAYGHNCTQIPCILNMC